ncbi:MAG TPA: hypothetical protein DCM62_04975 [Bacteroidales bacterium]|nr:hypothetical protein [Bacteroidales bacterium]
MKTVEELIKNSLKELKKIACENQESNKNQSSKLIFPQYCGGKQQGNKRISEQEARSLFIREVEKQEVYFYSVETPTKKSYKDFSTNEPKIGEKDGRAASVDVTLYTKENNKFSRKHLIEFKFGNVKTCKKDFLKLLCDDNECSTNYYVNILDNCDSQTIKSIKKKFKNSVIPKCQDAPNQKLSELKIFVFIYGENRCKDLPSNNFLTYIPKSNEFKGEII